MSTHHRTRTLTATLVALACLVTGAAGAPARGQPAATGNTALTGTVTDVSGAVMQAVPVRVFAQGREELLVETVTDASGSFAVALPAGTYRIEIAVQAFAAFEQVITVPRREPLDVRLDLEPIAVAVDVVPDDTPGATGSSLTSATLAGDDLLDLPRDEEELARYLMELAGADATGASEQDILANFIVDGFNDGRLPSPDRIAQVIIDPNAMSADGRGPRIEIVTRPGTGRWRRSVDFGFADESLNARTPGEDRKEPRQTKDAGLEIDGPVIPGVMQLRLQASTDSDEQAGNSLRAITPTGDLFQGVVRPRTGRELEIGVETQLNPSHRLDLLFARETERSTNVGVGGFSLPERGSDDESAEWTLRISERMFRQNFTNNIRVQVDRNTSTVTPLQDGVAIDVADAFAGGGGTNRSAEANWSVRLEDNLRAQRGAWSFQWGGRLQYRTERSIDRDNYNGTFEFASLHDYCLAIGFSGVNCAETERIVNDAITQGVAPVYTDARGDEAGIAGIPTTFTQASGNAELQFSELAFNSFVQADRRVGQKASLRLGVRYEGTNHSRDFLRLDPTVNLQYRLTETTVVSGGARLSFEDFRDYERLLRNDGSTYESELYISSPTFPDPFQGGGGETGARTASVWVLAPDYRAPYSVDPQVSVTQQVPGDVRLTLSYSGSHGFRQRRTRNINAPHPGTPLPDEILTLPPDERQDVIDRMRPLYPHVGNVTQIESTGRSTSRTLRLNVQPRGSLELAGVELSGNVSYTYRSADDDNDSNNPYFREWGRARRDHEVQSRFRVELPDQVPFAHPLARLVARATYEAMSLNFQFRANTGRLYSLRSGRDLNGDQYTSDRPAGVARNSEVGPANWRLDMTLTKNFRLSSGVAAGGGGEGSRGGRGRQQPDGPRLRFQARVDNLLNQAQPRSYVSTLTSLLFGLPTGYTSGRTISLSMSIDF